MIRLLIASDIRLYRDGLARVMRTELGDCEIVEAVSRPAVAEIFQHQTFDAALVDYAMFESMLAISHIHEHAPQTKVIVLTLPELDSEVKAYLAAGALTYVTRSGTIEELLEKIYSVTKRRPSKSPRRASRASKPQPQVLQPRVPLTAQENQVFHLICEGMSNKQIASELCIALSTTKNHVHNILQKLGATRRAEAIARYAHITLD
ncbi:MAG: response regulator transcription factor [Pseudomonadota bacterium]